MTAPEERSAVRAEAERIKVAYGHFRAPLLHSDGTWHVHYVANGADAHVLRVRFAGAVLRAKQSGLRVPQITDAQDAAPIVDRWPGAAA